MLIHAADERIKRYAAWNAGYELADVAVLKLLSNRLAAGTPNPEVARRFAQLYSFAIQRYIKGQQRNALTGASRGYLASVIAEVEDKCLSKLLGVRQPTLTRTLQEGNLESLQAEHDKWAAREQELQAWPGVQSASGSLADWPDPGALLGLGGGARTWKEGYRAALSMSRVRPTNAASST